ncbi:MAG TPA: hypothetical protein VJ327_04225 [Patescibacteria group bacterium]|nr:hypothetical protein [Patescibacteria group bacterium]
MIDEKKIFQDLKRAVFLALKRGPAEPGAALEELKSLKFGLDALLAVAVIDEKVASVDAGFLDEAEALSVELESLTIPQMKGGDDNGGVF